MINGDNPKNFLERLLYFFQCIINGFKGKSNENIIHRLELKNYKDKINKGTPSRRLSDMLWCSINWDNLSEQFGKKVNILDLGCGNGLYGYFFRDLLKDKFGSYSGLDVYRDNDFPSEFLHVQDTAENAHKYVEGINCVVSQSALEHIEADLLTLQNMTERLSYGDSKKFVQIHLVPASASLFLYLWHGWRQYSKKNLGFIADLLTSQSKIKIRLIPLGGIKCFCVHLFKITFPGIVRRLFGLKKIKDWDAEGTKTSLKIKECVTKEKYANDFLPSFWAVIVTSNDINIDFFLD